MADVPVEGAYPVVFLIFNTLSNLTTQDAQVRCFEQVTRHLTPEGVFVLEAGVPDPGAFRNVQYVNAETVEQDEVVFDVSRHDAVKQLTHKNHVVIREGAVRMYPGAASLHVAERDGPDGPARGTPPARRLGRLER